MRKRLGWGIIIMAACGLVFHKAETARGDEPASAAVHVIDNGTLRVEVMDPHHSDRYNQGVRFTPVAAVLGVVHEGVEYLYHPANHAPLTDRGGLAAEFDLCIPGGPSEDLPPGYLAAKEGEAFLKVGVGALKKTAKTYNLFQQPPLIEPAETTSIWRPDGASFVQRFVGETTPGYAYRMTARITLDGRRLVIEWSLENTGAKALVTRQYIHNFFRIADRDVGPGYSLSFPYDFKATGLEKEQKQDGRSIHFLETVPKWVNVSVPYPEQDHSPNTCLVRQMEVNRSILCETSLPGLYTAIHARKDYICPEQFMEIRLKPGQTQTWTRTYTFGASDLDQ